MENKLQSRPVKADLRSSREMIRPPTLILFLIAFWFLKLICLGLMVASKLIFEMHIKTVLARENKSIGLLCKSQWLFPRSSLVTSEFFVKFHLD